MSKKPSNRIQPQRFSPNRLAIAVSGALLWSACAAQAQEAAAPAASLDEVVVTGTQIRGAEVTGSQTISIDADAIKAVGAFSGNELLAEIPQVSNTFNQRPDTSPRNTAANTVSRPNLRAMPGFTGASGSTTLVLIDGHRGAGVGLIESSFDPDLISPGIIERVEILTDGGTSIYGADAVGGVINFVTKDEYDGVKIDLGYGSGDDFDQNEISLTAGTKWTDGSGYVSFSQSHRDNLNNNDRGDWAMLGNYAADGSKQPNGTQCLEPAGAKIGWYQYAPGRWTSNTLAPGNGTFPVGTPCDSSGEFSMMPEKDLKTAFFGVKQQLTDRLGMTVKGYYGERNYDYSYYPLGDTITGPTPVQLGLAYPDWPLSSPATPNTYFQPALGFSYGANAAYSQRSKETNMDTYGVTPEFTFEVNDNWQVRSTLYYGKSNTDYTEPDSNFLLASDYVARGLINPSDIASAPSTLIDEILDYKIAGETEQETYSARLIADGALFTLPAGELRAAVGVEYQDETATTRQALSGVTSAQWRATGDRSESRDVKSAFVEVAIPVFSMLDLSVSVRRDEYSDWGDTSNPNYGFKFTPLDWIKIYGHYGESFNAPTLMDTLATSRSRNTPDQWSSADPLQEFCTDAERAAGQCSPAGNKGVMQLLGVSDGLLPQTAENWAVGFDIKPPVVDGLTLRANYYEIDFYDALGAVNPQVDEAVLAQPDKFIFNPTPAEFQQYLGYITNVDETIAFHKAVNPNDPNGLPGAILDRRTANINAYELRGVDFGVDYVMDSSVGSWLFSLSGIKYLESTAIDVSGRTDLLDSNAGDLDMAGTIGWSRDALSARVRVNYSAGYDITGSTVGQDSVDEFIVTDLFVGYDFSGGDFTDGLSVRFFVDNVFDEDPPEIKRNNTVADKFTLGRTFRIGVSKSFD